ncbi:unnamed protein product [Schistosoma turkestanicum]|nr:unnamed protein product [Schistosoma turkestanicum]
MSKHRKTTLLRGFHFIVREETTPSTDDDSLSKTSLNSNIVFLDQLLDNKQTVDYLTNENTFLSNEINGYKLWTMEWLQKHLDILTEFGQILMKQSKNASVHINIEDILPITRLWHSDLQTGLPPNNLNLTDNDDDINSNQKIYFYWDMYAVLRKPSQYQIRPYLLNDNNSVVNNNIPSYYYLTIPPINSEKIDTTFESAQKKQDINDPCELFRTSDNVTLKNQPDRWNFISPEKICQLFFSILLPECLNGAMVGDQGQNSLKIISWKCLLGEDINKAIGIGYFPIEVVFDLSSLDVNSVYYSPKLWKTQQTSPAHPLTRRVQWNKNNTNQLSTSNLIMDNKSEKTQHSSNIIMTNLLIMRINFHPVYSLNDLMNESTLLSKSQSSLTNNQYTSVYWKHNFLKIIHRLQLTETTIDSNLPLWQICSCLSEDYILRRIDQADHGLHRKAIRILLSLCTITDQLQNTELLKLFTVRNMIHLCLHVLFEQSNQTVKQHYENLMKIEQKQIVSWQKTNLSCLIYQLLKKMINVLNDKQLASFTSPESDLLNIEKHGLTKQSISRSRAILNSWLHSPLELKKVIMNQTEVLLKYINKFKKKYECG